MNNPAPTSDIIELAKLYFDDYSKKHEHFWNMYFKFVFAIICLLGIFLFTWQDSTINTEINSTVSASLFALSEIIISLFSTIILSREYYVVKTMNDQYSKILLRLNIDRIPENRSQKNFITNSKIRTGQLVCWSVLILGFLCVFIIVVSQLI